LYVFNFSQELNYVLIFVGYKLNFENVDQFSHKVNSYQYTYLS